MKTILENYGVKLVLLTQDKIEMVRQWRTDPKISQYMDFRGEITKEMQEKWFFNLNNGIDNFYWLIVYKDEEIGLINIKDVDYQNKTGETGVFIYDDKYLNTDVAYRAHLVMFDFAYSELGLGVTRSHILKLNVRAQRFGIFLGSRLAEGQDDTENQLYLITKEDYFNNVNRLHFLRRYNKRTTSIQYTK